MNIWVVIYRVSCAALGVLLVIGILSMFSPQYKQYRENERRAEELEYGIALEEEMLKTLRRKQERFRSDPRFVEQIAREIGLAKPGETIFKFMDDPETSSPPP